MRPLAALVVLVAACSRDALPPDGGTRDSAASPIDASVRRDATAPIDATIPIDAAVAGPACGDMQCTSSQVCQHFVCQRCATPLDGGACPDGSSPQMFGGPPFCATGIGPACVTNMAYDQEPPRCVDIPAGCTTQPACECQGFLMAACSCPLDRSSGNVVDCWCY